MDVSARFGQSFNVRGDVRKPLVHHARVYHPVGARQADAAHEVGVAGTPHDRKAVRAAVGRIGADRRLGPVARV